MARRVAVNQALQYRDPLPLARQPPRLSEDTTSPLSQPLHLHRWKA